MVTHPGKTLCPGAFKPVNLPEPVLVEEDAGGLPVDVKAALSTSPGRSRTPLPEQSVQAIDDYWRIDDEWWRDEPVSRLYYAVRLASGQRLTIYKDLITRQWYRQGY